MQLHPGISTVEEFGIFHLITYRTRTLRGILPDKALMGSNLSLELNSSMSPDNELFPEWFMLTTAARR